MAERFPRIRRTPIPADAPIVVRGDEVVDDTSRVQAVEFRRRYPDWQRWGLSAFYAADEPGVDRLAAERLERFPILRLYQRAGLADSGFEIVPTFRSPHVTIAFDGDLGSGLEQLLNSDHEMRANPYHDPGTQRRT